MARIRLADADLVMTEHRLSVGPKTFHVVANAIDLIAVELRLVEIAEVTIEGVILLHDHDDVLDRNALVLRADSGGRIRPRAFLARTIQRMRELRQKKSREKKCHASVHE